jgi:prepilin signal peptidase PulO-like enzyme (type II secretory pathway)
LVGVIEVLLALVFVALLIPVTVIDLEYRIIPNSLLLWSSIIALILLVTLRPSLLIEHLGAALIASGFFLVAALAYPRGMGMGDVKFVFVMGLFLGVKVAVAVAIALLLGTLIGVILLVRRGQRTPFAFGPMLAVGGLIALLVGGQLVNWYISMM